MMNKKNFKIVRLYIISLICIVCYFLLENSTIIPELVQISEKGRYSGFPTFFLTGLLKYGLLVVGIGIIIILTFLLIKERTIKRLNK
jgi:type II secretory pathway component PulF